MLKDRSVHLSRVVRRRTKAVHEPKIRRFEEFNEIPALHDRVVVKRLEEDSKVSEEPIEAYVSRHVVEIGPADPAAALARDLETGNGKS